MALFDYYVPVPAIRCPACDSPLADEWQGTDGPCAMFVWQQGKPAPIDERVDDELRHAADELSRFRLPARFRILTYCCSRRFPVEADCESTDGTWSATSVVTAENARQRRAERRADYNARLRWLAGSPALK